MARRRSSKRDQPYEPLDVERLSAGIRRTETRSDGVWTVQDIVSASANKLYTCPGCHGTIEPGVAHVVAWRSDNIMGEQAGLDARRHWHKHCWKIG